MKPIQILQDELVKRITVTELLITELKNSENAILAIENILFKYNLKASEIKLIDFVNISDEDFSIIIAEIGEQKIAELTENFSRNKEIVKLYKSIIGTHGNVAEAPQYEDALNELNILLLEINNYLSNHEQQKNQQVNSLEESVFQIKNTYEIFAGGELKKPIFDMLTFLDLLNNLGFDQETKSEIKKIVGQLNYKLVMEKGLSKSEDEKLLDKYRVILQRKKQEHGKTYNDVQEFISKSKTSINLDNIEKTIKDFLIKTDYSYEVIKNAVVCHVLEREISAFDKALIEKNNLNDKEKDKTIVLLEKLLVISRETAPLLSETKEKETKKRIAELNNDKIEKEIIQKENEVVENKAKEKEIIAKEETIKIMPKVVEIIPKDEDIEIKQKEEVIKTKEKETSNEQINQKDNFNEKDFKLIEEIKLIVSEENALLQRMGDNDTTRLTEISEKLENYSEKADSLEKEELSLAFLAETLRLNLLFFEQLLKNYKENPLSYQDNYTKMVSELKDYILTYRIIKKRANEYNDLNNNTIKK